MCSVLLQLLGRRKKTNFAALFAFHFPQMGCQLSATSRQTIERGEGTETRASIPLPQPCVRECKLCPWVSRMFCWAETWWKIFQFSTCALFGCSKQLWTCSWPCWGGGTHKKGRVGGGCVYGLKVDALTKEASRKTTTNHDYPCNHFSVWAHL